MESIIGSMQSVYDNDDIMFAKSVCNFWEAISTESEEFKRIAISHLTWKLFANSTVDQWNILLASRAYTTPELRRALFHDAPKWMSSEKLVQLMQRHSLDLKQQFLLISLGLKFAVGRIQQWIFR